MENDNLHLQAEDSSYMPRPPLQTSLLNFPARHALLPSLLSVLSLPFSAREGVDTSSLFLASLLESCSQSSLGQASPLQGQTVLTAYDLCKSVAVYFKSQASDVERCSKTNALSLSCPVASTTSLEACGPLCSIWVPVLTIASSKSMADTAEVLENSPRIRSEAFSTARQKRIRFDSLSRNESVDLDYFHNAPLAAKTCSALTAISPLQTTSCDVLSQTDVFALFEEACRESQANDSDIQKGVIVLGKREFSLPCTFPARRLRLTHTGESLQAHIGQVSEIIEEEDTAGKQVDAVRHTENSRRSLQPPFISESNDRKRQARKSTLGPTEFPPRVNSCPQDTAKQATEDVAGRARSGPGPTFAGTTTRRRETSPSLPRERRMSLVQEPSSVSIGLAPLGQGCERMHSQMPLKTKEFKGSGNTCRRSPATTGRLVSTFLPDVCDPGASPRVFDRQHPVFTKTAKCIKTSFPRPASWQVSCPLYDSPSASPSVPAPFIQSELKVAPEHHLQVMEAITASQHAIRRAERLAARASREVTAATYAATRVASEVAGLLGLPAQQLFRECTHRSGDQHSSARVHSAKVKNTLALGAAAVDLVGPSSSNTNGMLRTRSMKLCCSSPPAECRANMHVCGTPLGPSPVVSPPHCPTTCNLEATISTSSGKRPTLATDKTLRDTNTQCGNWGPSATESTRLYEATSTGSSALQGYLCLHLRRQVKQQKLRPPGVSGESQIQSVCLGHRVIPENKDDLARVAAESSSDSAAAGPPRGTLQAAEEHTSPRQDSMSADLFTAFHSSAHCSSSSSTLKGQLLLFDNDKWATPVPDKSGTGRAWGHAETEDTEALFKVLSDEGVRIWEDNVLGVDAARNVDVENRVIHVADVGTNRHSGTGLTSNILADGLHTSVASQVGVQKTVTMPVHVWKRDSADDSPEQGYGGSIRREEKVKLQENGFPDETQQKHLPAIDRFSVLAPSCEPSTPSHSAEDCTAAQEKLDSPRSRDNEEKIKHQKRAAMSTCSEPDHREEKLARTSRREEVTKAVTLLHLTSFHRVASPPGADGGVQPVSLPSNVEPAGNKGRATLDSRTDTHHKKSPGRSRSNVCAYAGHAYRRSAPSRNPLDAGGTAMRQEKLASQQQSSGLHALTRNKRKPAELVGAQPQYRCFAALNKSSSQPQLRAAEEKCKLPCERYAYGQPRRQPGDYLPDALRRASLGLQSTKVSDGYKKYEKVDDTRCGCASKCNCRSIVAIADRGRQGGRLRSLDQLSAEVIPSTFSEEHYIAQLPHNADQAGARRRQLNYLCGARSFSPRHSHSSSPASPGETARSSSPLGATPWTLQKHPPTPLVRVHHGLVDAFPVAKDTGRGCEETPHVVPPDSPRGTMGSTIATNEASRKCLAANVKSEDLHLLGSTYLDLLNTALLKDDKQLSAGSSQFKKVTVGQHTGMSESRTRRRTPVEIFEVESGTLKSGIGNDILRGVGCRSKWNTTITPNQGSDPITESLSSSVAGCDGPSVGNSIRDGTTSLSACSLQGQNVTQTSAQGPSKNQSGPCILTVNDSAPGEAALSLPMRAEEGVDMGDSRRFWQPARQILPRCLPSNGPGASGYDTCSNALKGADGGADPHATGAASNKRHASRAGVKCVAETRTGKREEKSCKFFSNVPGVSYRSAPHCGWRFRWKDHENGKEHSRCFSVNKFGFQEAKKQAESIAMDIRGKLLAEVAEACKENVDGNEWRSTALQEQC